MTKRDQNMVVLALVAVVAAAAYWYFLWTPAHEELNLVEARVARLDSLNGKAKKEVSSGRLEKVRQETEIARRSLAAMRLLVPTENEVPALLDQVSVAAREAGLEMAGVKPKPVIAGPEFDTHAYEVSVVGPYHQTVQFLSDVGSLTRIMAPVGVKVERLARVTEQMKRRQVKGELLSVNFELQTFVARTATDSASKGGAN